MKINPQIIRGYDVRGIAEKDLSSEIAEHFGKAYGTFIREKGATKVVVGYDSRKTSPEYSEALIKGILSTGLDVVDIGMVLVGIVYWAQYYFQTIGAVMVTASHNPPEYNGFKFGVDFSETMTGPALKELQTLIESENYFKADQPGNLEKKDVKQAYFDDLLKRFNFNKSFKIVVDASCATAGVFAPELFRQAGHIVVEQNCEIDSSFPLGVADPTEVVVAERLAKKVVEVGADIGFSFDADGDRVGVVDEKGGIIWNDVLLAIFAKDVLADYPGSKIMFNALCSKVVPETIAQFGGEPFMWRTGHGFLKKKNQEIGAPFIGELSGHFFFSKDFYNHDDGLYAALRVLQYMDRNNETLSQAVQSLPKYISSPEIKVGCPDDKKVDLTKHIAEILKKDFPQAKVIDDESVGDGVRLETQSSMFIIRYSQNGPYLTIKFEAKQKDEYEDLKKYIHDLLKSFNEIDWSFGVNVESLN